MKVEIDKKVVGELLDFIKIDLGVETMKKMWAAIRTDWKVNPLKFKGSIKLLLSHMQDKFKMLDDFATMVMTAAEEARNKIKAVKGIDPESVSGSAALEACAKFLDSIVNFPYTLAGRIAEYFDREIILFVLQFIFYFRKKDIEDK